MNPLLYLSLLLCTVATALPIEVRSNPMLNTSITTNNTRTHYILPSEAVPEFANISSSSGLNRTIGVIHDGHSNITLDTGFASYDPNAVSPEWAEQQARWEMIIVVSIASLAGLIIIATVFWCCWGSGGLWVRGKCELGMPSCAAPRRRRSPRARGRDEHDVERGGIPLRDLHPPRRACGDRNHEAGPSNSSGRSTRTEWPRGE